MEMLDERVEREAKRLKRDLERRGVRVIDDSDSVGVMEDVTIKTNERNEPKPLPQSIPQRTNALDKFKAFYYYLTDSGLYIQPSLELNYGVEHEIPMDDAGVDKLIIPKEAYNANLTFTILTGLLQNSAMLSFGPPGSGKTTAAEFVISGIYNVTLSDIQEATILGNPELTEEKMLAYIDLTSFIKHKEVIGVRKFMKNPGRLIDEANRMSPSKSSLLLNILDRGWAIYNNRKIKATPGPLFATVNGKDYGNYETTPAFIDRFDIAITALEMNPEFIGYYTEMRNNKIRFIEDMIVKPPKKIDERDLINARKEIYHNIKFDSVLMNKLAHFLAELLSCYEAGMQEHNKTKGNALYEKPGPLCKDCKYFNYDNSICHSTEDSLSARTIASVYAYSKALSWWRGKAKVEEEDLKYALSFASWFKLNPTRKIKEKEKRFKNDRISMVYHLWDTSSKSYDEIVTVFPEYKGIVKTVTDYCRNKSRPSKSELLDMMHSLKKIDSPTKFQLGTALKWMYMNYDRQK